MNGMNFKKYYQQLVTSLVEKLSDSKVVIRQAVLKSCSYLITVSVILTNLMIRTTKQVLSLIMQ
jgi:hypothetical protein